MFLMIVMVQLVTIPAGASTVEPGKTLAQQLCSRCHAIETAGDSPHPDAPPFRTIHRLYPVDSLAEALAEGIVTGHPDMPEFKFQPDDVSNLIDYLISIQVR